MKEAYLRAQKSHERSIFEQGRTIGWIFLALLGSGLFLAALQC